MPTTIFVPSPLRKLTAGASRIQVTARTLQEAIARADEAYPGLRERILNEDGEIKRFINIFVNGVDVRQLQGRATTLKDGDEVAVIPAMAGGDETRSDGSVRVGVDWLKQHLDQPSLFILDARVSDPRLPLGYKMGHVPGAIAFDLNRDAFEAGPGMPRLQSPERIAETLGARGISNDSTVVLYDEGTGPLAGFVFWLLKYLGHRELKVLDGGWYAWRQAGAEATREIRDHAAAEYIARVNENQRASAEWVQKCAERDDATLLDTRSDAEYYMGHIAGAINLSFDQAVNFETQALKPEAQLRDQFAGVGVTPDKEIVTYCGSGSRSAHTYMVLKSLGFPRVRNYDGSLLDWAQRRGLPLE